MGGELSKVNAKIESFREETCLSTTLTLSNRQLKEIPQIPSIDRLKELNLSLNKLTSNTLVKPCDSLLSQPNLKILRLAENQLSEHLQIHLPSTLEEIDLTRNQITSVVFDLSPDSNLKRIHLDMNVIAQFPVELLLIPSLTSLSLIRNKISIIKKPSEEDTAKIQEHSSLESLILDHNELQTFPDLSFLPKLTSLSLDGNQISVIDEGAFANLNSLTSLCVSNNQMKEIRIHPDQLVNLRFFDVMGNKLTEIPSLVHMKKLTWCSLRMNEISTLPPFPNSLKSLNFQDNLLTRFPDDLPLESLRELLANRNLFTEIPLDIIQRQTLNGLTFDYSVPDMVCPGLYLGSEESSAFREFLDTVGVTHILRVKTGGEIPYPEDFVYKVIPVGDVSTEDISIYFEEAFEFIQSALAGGGKVVVHCAQGVSRSATIVIGYVMKSQNIGFAEALAFVKSKRPVVMPNRGFRKQLEMYLSHPSEDINNE